MGPHFWSEGVLSWSIANWIVNLIYISSLSGHYVPQLSKVIHERNKGVANPVINFKGFMVNLYNFSDIFYSHDFI